jgi:hypothetical protein
MLEHYLPQDVCNIIRNKLSSDYVKYKAWCCVEARWIYIWTQCNTLCNIKCPLDDNHEIYPNFVYIISTIKADGRILKFDKSTSIDNVITQDDFQIIKI